MRIQSTFGNMNKQYAFAYCKTTTSCYTKVDYLLILSPLSDLLYGYDTRRIVSVCLKQMDTFYHSISYNARAVLTTISHTDRKMHDLLPGQLPAPCIRLAASNIDVICARI